MMNMNKCNQSNVKYTIIDNFDLFRNIINDFVDGEYNLIMNYTFGIQHLTKVIIANKKIKKIQYFTKIPFQEYEEDLRKDNIKIIIQLLIKNYV